MSNLRLTFAAALVAVVSFAGFSIVSGGTVYAVEAPDCGDNSIVRCGVMNADELKTKYEANDRNAQAIFGHFNITKEDIVDSENAKSGYVNPDGTVTVDGKVVANSAYSAGRTNMNGSSTVKISNTTTIYQGQGRVKSPLSTYVFFNDDGSFKAAIIKVCGNPVKATPVKTVMPTYACETLKADKISRNEYRFITTATAKDGATIKGYTYDFGDNETEAGGSVVRHAYEAPGDYVASVTVQVEVNGEVEDVSGDCDVTVTVKKDMVQACEIKTGTIVNIDKSKIDDTAYTLDTAKCEKVKYCDTVTKTYVTVLPHDKKSTYTTDDTQCEAVPVVELPRTGMAELLGGGLGAGSLSFAGYHYFASRRIV